MSARLKEPEFHGWELEGASVAVTEPSRSVHAAYARRGVPLLFLAELWVPPARRGRGLAGRLMQAVTRWADRTGTDLWLWAEPYGKSPRASLEELSLLYTKYGFERVAKRSAIYQMIRRHGKH